MHQEQFSMVYFAFYGEPFDSSDHGIWLHVINWLYRWFLSDDVFLKAHDEVERATQSDREDEAKLAKRLSIVARLCKLVFPKH